MTSTAPHVELADARIHYETRGERGSPVLLVMGFGVPGHMWANQIEAFAARHRVAWFDNAGAGETTRTRRTPATMHDLGRHAVAVLDALGWADAHLVGVSMGGMVAQEVGLSWRGRVRSLSLIATHAGGLRNLTPPLRSLLMLGLAFLGPRARRAAVLERLVFPADYLATIDAATLRRAMDEHVVASSPPSGRLLQAAAVLTHRTAHRLHALAATPTLVVKASRDLVIRPRELDRLHRLIPGSRLVEFADAGHAVIHQCAAQLNAVLLEHFATADAATGQRARDQQ